MDQQLVTLITSYLYSREQDDLGTSHTTVQKTASEINNRHWKLLDVVQGLGEHLTDSNEKLRVSATQMLSDTLDNLQPAILPNQQLNVMLRFLCDRLTDEACAQPVLEGILALVPMKAFRTDEIGFTLQTLSKEMNIRQYSQNVRFVCFQIHDKLMALHRDTLKSMNDDYIPSLIKAVEGEKDPRNLMLAFSIINVVLVEFNITQFVQELFDITFCYFPITFRPRPDDPYGITTEDLKLRLRQCIAATPHFGANAIPSLLEKLNASSNNVKKDALQTLVACIENYGSRTVGIFAPQIWDNVKFEVLHAMEDDLAEESLLTLKAVTGCLSHNVHDVQSNSSLETYLKAIVDECRDELKEPHQKQGRPSARIIAVCASASPAAHKYLFQNILPPLFTYYNDTSSVPARRAFLEAFNEFLDAHGSVFGTEDSPQAMENAEESVLMGFKDQTFEVLSSALVSQQTKAEISLRLTAIIGLRKLILLKDLLTMNERNSITHYMDIVVIEEENEDLCEAAMKTLAELSRHYPDLILHTTFPALFAQLPDSDEETHSQILGEATKPYKPYSYILSALGKISIERPLFQALLIRLFSKFDVVVEHTAAAKYPALILNTISTILRTKDAENHSDLPTYIDRLFQPLLYRSIVPLCKGGNATAASKEVVGVTAKILTILMRHADETTQNALLVALFNIFIHTRPSTLMGRDAEQVAQQYKPIDLNSNQPQCRSLMLFTASFAGARPGAVLPLENVASFVLFLMDIPSKPSYSGAVLHLISLLVNKHLSKQDQVRIVQHAEKVLESALADNATNIEPIFWICKALCSRGDTAGYKLTVSLLQLLQYPAYEVARLFEIIIKDNELLNKQNYGVVKILAKQKYYSIISPKVIEGFNTASEARYMVVLAGILRNSPTSVVLPELGSLLPVLLQSLQLNNAAVKTAILDTLFTTLLELPTAVTSHLQTLLPHMISCAVESDKNPIAVRMAALRCLAVAPLGISAVYLQQYKRDVIRGLSIALDDPKRSVRKEAVDARQKWYSIDDT